MTAAQRVELCMAVDEFTSSYAKLLALKIKVEDGECLEQGDIDMLSSLADTLSCRMENVTRLEEKFEFESVGIPIDGNTNFQGFSLREGELVGDLSYAYRIAMPWYCNFYKGERTETADFFKFFMASFIISLKDMYYPQIIEELREEEEKQKQKEDRKKRFRFLPSFFRKGA